MICGGNMKKIKHKQKEKEKKEKKEQKEQKEKEINQNMQSFNSFENQNSLFQQNKIFLPANYAEDMLFLEMEMEAGNVTLEKINQLLELYRFGVEYFEAIKNERYKIFKNKTQQLLMKPAVISCMNLEIKEDKENNMNQQNVKQREMELHLSSVNKREMVQRMVLNHKKEEYRVKQIIDKNINEQNSNFERRLERRKSVKKIRERDYSLTQIHQ